MTYQLPNKKKYAELNDAERAYFEAMAKSEADKLLRHMSGSDDFKKLVAAHLSQIATPPKPSQVTSQGPTQEFLDYINGGEQQ